MVGGRGLLAPVALVALILVTGFVVETDLSSQVHTSTVTSTHTVTVAPYTVNVSYKEGIGFYLTNASGFTLYFLSTDPGNGTSTCTGGCVSFWPLFYVSPGSLILPQNLNPSSFGVAIRSDGLKQLTFNGYPLYYFAKDTSPGQVNGEGDHGFFACCSEISVSTTATTSTSTSSANH